MPGRNVTRTQAFERSDDGAERRTMRDAAAAYIPGFDGLRAIAVAIVLVAHAGYDRTIPGGFGVTIFFAISGYLITNLLITEYARTDTIDLKLFYARRIVRLYPELIVLVVACLVFGPIFGWDASLNEKLASFLYYMNYYYIFGGNDGGEIYPWRQLWSLAVEEHFYIFFPGLMLFVARDWRSRLLWISGLIVVPLLWRFITYDWLHLPSEYNYAATDTRIDSIAWGCLLALLMREASGAVRTSDKLWFISPAATALGLAMILGSLVYRDESFRWTWRFTLQGIGIVLLIANVLFDRRWRFVVDILEYKYVRYIGRISYGLYLYHMFVNKMIEKIWPGMTGLTFLSLSLVGSVAAGGLSHRLLETPFKPLRRRLGSQVR